MVNLQEIAHIKRPIAIIECPPTNNILYFMNIIVKIEQIAPKKFELAIMIFIVWIDIVSSSFSSLKSRIFAKRVSVAARII